MSRNPAGDYELPAGNPVTTGTVISSTVHNNTMSDIADELTDSLSRTGSGGMTAPLALTNGSAGTPALSFSTESTSGLYRQGSNDLRFSVGGTSVQRWTPTGVVFPAGAVLTQTTSDTSAIDVTGNGTASGVDATGGSTSGTGVIGTGGVTNGIGVDGVGTGSGVGVRGTGGVTGAGVTGTGGATSGVGVVGTGTGASAGVTGTGGATNGVGVVGTGTGTATGVTGAGGATNGIGVTGAGVGTGAGVTGTGGATGVGLQGIGGATSGAGGVFTGTAGDANGVTATGQGTGSGIAATGGGNGGAGAVFTGGATNGNGVFGIGVGNGVGGKFFNSPTSTAPALEVVGASAAAAASFDNPGGGVSLQVGSGHVKLVGGNPISSTGFTNTLTPKNISKAWVRFVTNGAGGITLAEGFNVSGVAITGGGTTATVTFATAMADNAYGVTTGISNEGGSDNPIACFVFSRSTASFVVMGIRAAAPSNIIPIDFSNDQAGFTLSVLGAQ